MKRPRIWAAVAIFAVVAVACGGQSLQVSSSGGEIQAAGGDSAAADDPNLAAGGSVSVGQAGTKTTGGKGADPRCATNSNPEQGYTADSLKWGTVITVSGIFEKLGKQTARVMQLASEGWMNSISKIPGPYPIEWGCSQRPGIFGRKVSLKVFTLPSRTPDDALSAMRRLIDVEKVFLVRDCYLQSDIMGAATQYQNDKGVPGVWCSYSEMALPALAKWNFSPGVDPLKIVGVHTGWLLNNPNPALRKSRMAILADPTARDNAVKIARRVASAFNKPIPDSCVILAPAAEAQNGRDAEIARMRGCHGGQDPDTVLVMDAANAVFAASAAAKNGWRGKDNNVQWACATCWVVTLAEICGTACEDMVTDCQALPCIPWADPGKYPAMKVLEDVRKQYLGGQPIDILTYGPAAITGGLGLWLGMTGPNLSRDGLRNTLENLKNWDAGIGPILNTGPQDHYGGKSVWLIQFAGREGGDPQGKAPWFRDLTGRFMPLSELGVSESLTQN